MNQLDIDPAELRGIGIQMNKLECRIVKGTGCIENFISNMKSKKNKSQTFLNENTDSNKMISKIAEPKNHQVSSTINTRQTTEIISTKHNKPKTVIDFFKPIKENLNTKKLTTHSNLTSNILHQSLVNINMSHVDPAFLDALPTHLRQEIENELNTNKHQNNNFSSTKYEDIEPTDVTMTEESSKLYQHVNVDQMKEFVEEWVTTENEPKTCDNIMVSEYLCNLVKDTKTEDAYEIIRKLYR